MIPAEQYIFDTSRTVTLKNLDLLLKSLNDEANLASQITIEQIFLRQFNINTTYRIIKILLAEQSPSISIALFKTGKKYIDEEYGKLVFKEKYTSQKRRKLEPYIQLIKNQTIYFITGISGLSTLYVTYKMFDLNKAFDTTFIMFNFMWATIAVTLGIILLIISIKALINVDSIKDAEKLLATVKPSSRTKYL